MNVNKVFLAGNLTRDPEVSMMPNNKPICKFGIASNRKWKTESGEPKEEVCFVDCVAFGKTGEIIGQYFSKGKPIFIEGRLKFEQWEAKDGGGKRNRLTVIADNFQFVGGKSDSGGNQSSLDEAAVAVATGEGLPF